MSNKRKPATQRQKQTAQSRIQPPSFKLPSCVGQYYPLLLYITGLILSAIFLGKALSPFSILFGTDFMAAGYPNRKFLIEVLTKYHHLPLWQPYIYGGFPYIHSLLSTDLFYPVSILLRSFPLFVNNPHLIPPYLYLLHFPLALLLTYLFLKEIGLGRISSTISGFAYMFTGQIASLIYAGHDAKIVISCLLPGFFWLVYRGLKRTGLSGLLQFVWAGGLLGCTLLFSHVQMIYYSLIATGLFWMILLILEFSKNPQKRFLARGVAGFAIIIILGFALGAVQFLPFYSYIQFSPRGGEGRGLEFAKSWSMPPEETIDAIIPDFSGMSIANTSYDTYWGKNIFKLHSEYLGVLTLLLAVLGVVLYWKNRYTRIFLALLILGLLIAWGGYTPLYFLISLLPKYKSLRASSMAFFLVSFFTVCLAGLGVEGIFKKLEEKDQGKGSRSGNRNLFLGLGITASASLLLGLIVSGAREGLIQFLSNQFITGSEKYQQLVANYDHFVSGTFLFALFLVIQVVLLILLLRKILPRIWWAGLAIGLLIVDLWHIDFRFHQIEPIPSHYLGPDEVVNIIEKDNSLYRVFPLQYNKMGNYLLPFWIQNILGEAGNQLKRYNEFVGAGKTNMVDIHNLRDKPNFLNLIGTKYLITTVNKAEDYVQRAGFILPRLKLISNGPFKIYENLDVLPRAFCVGKYEVIQNSEKILERIGQTEFNPGKVAILEEEPRLNLPPQDTLLRWSINITRDTIFTDNTIPDDPNQVLLDCETSAPSLLILSQNHYPAWKTSIDGRASKVFRANYTFCAVFLPEGKHRVLFHFESQEYQIGGKISLIALILLVLSLLVPFSINLAARIKGGRAS